MKNIFFASMIAVLGLGVQSFAQDEDDYSSESSDQVEYATETTSYAEEDDGYGNPLPKEEPAPVAEAPASSASAGGYFDKTLNLAWHLGFGFNGLHNTPTEYSDYGADDPNEGFTGANVSLGIFSLIHINSMFSIAPELEFTFRFLSQTLDEFRWWGDYYKIEKNLYLFDFDIPVTVRFNPVHFVYLEAGAQLGLSLGSGSDYTLTRESDGKVFDSLSPEENDEESWSSESVFFSLVFGAGATFELNAKHYDVGLRLVYDLTNLHKDNKDVILNEKDEPVAVVTNESRMWAVQLVVNYWFL